MAHFRAFLTLAKTSGLRSFGIALILTILSAFSAINAQTSTGRISGTVTDAGGAIIPNATVTISDPTTNFSRTITTDDSGFYTATNLAVGTYTVSVELANFKKSIKTDNSLSSDGRLTVDFSLEAGQITEIVQVEQTHGETVNTTSGEVGKVIDNQQVDNLALNGRNYYQLLSVIPGAVVTADDALDTNLATNTININGNRGVSNNLTVDGGNNLNAGSNASQINNVGLDFIQEVKLQTSNFSAEYGRNSGAQINVVTKRGNNGYHGTLFEFGRNDRFDSRDAFAATQPFLRYNNYGYSFGGPLPFPNFGEGGPVLKSGKDKFFFFGGQEWKKIHRFAASNPQTLPTTAELNGDFSFRLRGADGIVGTADDGVLRDPTLGLPCTAASGTNPAVRTGCFANNIIPTARITSNGLALANVYRSMISLASGYSDTPTGNNATFQPAIASDFRQEFIRLDYLFNENQSINGRYIHDNNVVVDPYGTFINSPLPTSQQLRNRPGNGLQFGYLWNIKSTLVNDMRFNAAWSDQRVVPNTQYSFRETYGYTFNQLFPNGGQYENSIPNTSFAGSGTFASFSGVAATLTALTRDYGVYDTLTWVKGNHTLKFGAVYNYNQTFQNGRSLYAGSVNYNGSTTIATSSYNALADALLGNFRTYSEASSDPSSHFRFKQYEAFALDSWRVNKHLSLEVGLRYQFGKPFYTAENTIANFDPAKYDPSRAVTLNQAGTVVTIGTGNRFNGLVRAGDGVPIEYQGLISSVVAGSIQAVPSGAPRGFYDGKNYFMPRVSFAYSPFDNNKTSIRGGFGMYYDRVEGNIIFPLENNPPFVDSGSYENGNLSNIRGGSASAIAPFAAITTIDPDFKASSSMNFSLGIQRELPFGIFVEATGVGNLGRHLTRQRDINSVSFSTLSANLALPTAQQFGTNALRPFKGFSNINQRTSDANSHYYALQLYAAKRKGDLLATVSYTWSKVLADANVLTEAAEEGNTNRNFNYGPASFDRRHIFVATYTYAVPFFKKSSGWARSLLYGYEISGITRLQAGKPYTITGSSPTGNRRADVNSAAGLYLKDGRQYLNPGAFSPAAPGILGNSGVSIVTGPVLAVNDFSVRKKFNFGERMNLRLQGDIFNAFNHNNFSGISTNCPSVTNGLCTGGFGLFTSSGPGRSIQYGVKFAF